MAILAYDDVMLREPRLLVPGMQPLGPVKIDWSHPLTRRLTHFVAALPNGTIVQDLVGNPITWTLSANVTGVSKKRVGMKTVWVPEGTYVTSGSIGIEMPSSITTADDITCLATAYFDASFTADIGIASFNGGSWSWLDYVATELRTSVFTTYDTANPINTAGFHNYGWIWRANNTYQFIRNGIFTASGTATRQSIGGGKVGLYRYDNDATVRHHVASGYQNALEWQAIWARSLTEADTVSMYRDPYQFLIPA